MSEGIRTERRFGVTSQLTPEARRNLLSMRNSDAWPDLLDVMEMCCIEIETDLINTDAAKEADVLANHKMTKAAWKIFTHFQAKVDDEVALYLRSVEKPTLVPPLSPYDQLVENIIDPTKPLPPEYEN